MNAHPHTNHLDRIAKLAWVIRGDGWREGWLVGAVNSASVYCGDGAGWLLGWTLWDRSKWIVKLNWLYYVQPVSQTLTRSPLRRRPTSLFERSKNRYRISLSTTITAKWMPTTGHVRTVWSFERFAVPSIGAWVLSCLTESLMAPQSGIQSSSFQPLSINIYANARVDAMKGEAGRHQQEMNCRGIRNGSVVLIYRNNQ